MRNSEVREMAQRVLEADRKHELWLARKESTRIMVAMLAELAQDYARHSNQKRLNDLVAGARMVAYAEAQEEDARKRMMGQA